MMDPKWEMGGCPHGYQTDRCDECRAATAQRLVRFAGLEAEVEALKVTRAARERRQREAEDKLRALRKAAAAARWHLDAALRCGRWTDKETRLEVEHARDALNEEEGGNE